MAKLKHGFRGSLGERIATAFVSAVFCALTLFAYPLAVFFVAATHGHGGGKAPSLFVHYYALLFSMPGTTIIGLAGAAGFTLGPERMAGLFSFFWGTHEFWPRLRHKIESWSEDHVSEGLVLILLVVILAVVVWVQFA